MKSWDDIASYVNHSLDILPMIAILWSFSPWHFANICLNVTDSLIKRFIAFVQTTVSWCRHQSCNCGPCKWIRRSRGNRLRLRQPKQIAISSVLVLSFRGKSEKVSWRKLAQFIIIWSISKWNHASKWLHFQTIIGISWFLGYILGSPRLGNRVSRPFLEQNKASGTIRGRPIWTQI